MTKKKKEEGDISIEGLTGIGPAGKEKLNAIGVTNVFDLCIRGSPEIKDATQMPQDKLDAAMQEALESVYSSGRCRPRNMTVFELEEYKNNLIKIKCGCDELDRVLKGGLEQEALTEIYGEFGSGKTQYCNSVAVEAIKQYDFNVLWIDCEDTFDPGRIVEIIMARGYATTEDEAKEKFFPKITYVHTPNTDILETTINNLSQIMLEKDIKLIVIDGSIGQYREEYPGRGVLGLRQNHLSRFMGIVKNIAHFFKCAIVITNQVQADPGMMFGDPIKPIGGNVVAHTSTYRLYFKKAGSKRIARMVDSPKGPIEDVRFELNAKGIDNVSG